MKLLKNYIKLSDEVYDALINKKPIVALESTIISHGMPFPENLKTAQELEKIVRENNAIPATIAIINGFIHVGLTNNELEYLASPNNKSQIIKVSRRDLVAVLAKKLSGATTVAATMLIAHLVGIKVFATGGIGGVHRKAEVTMDISADLQELAQTNVTVVCAGVKSILDIGLTLEYLETNGVTVYGYQTKQFPAFYLRDSGFSVDYTINTPQEFAQIIRVKDLLKLKGGQILANPVPVEYEIDANLINSAIDQALNEIEVKQIKGKAITPFLLAKITDITAGKSLRTNIGLVYNNAKVAAQVANEISKNNS